MKRSRLALAFILAVVLMGTYGASFRRVRLRKLTATGWYTIFKTFTLTSAGEGCGDFPGWSYKVAMSVYLYNSGGTTFKVQSVAARYTVTAGRIWADSFVMFGSFSRSGGRPRG